MADFTINVTKGERRAAVRSENKDATEWLQVNGLSCVPLDTCRVVSYVDERLVSPLREVLSSAGFQVDVNIT